MWNCCIFWACSTVRLPGGLVFWLEAKIVSGLFQIVWISVELIFCWVRNVLIDEVTCADFLSINISTVASAIWFPFRGNSADVSSTWGWTKMIVSPCQMSSRQNTLCQFHGGRNEKMKFSQTLFLDLTAGVVPFCCAVLALQQLHDKLHRRTFPSASTTHTGGPKAGERPYAAHISEPATCTSLDSPPLRHGWGTTAGKKKK